MRSQDLLNAYQQQCQINQQKRIADELAKRNAAIKGHTAAVEMENAALREEAAAARRQMDAMRMRQEAEREAQQFGREVACLVHQDRMHEKLSAVVEALDEFLINIPESAGASALALPDQLSQHPEYVSKVVSRLSEIRPEARGVGLALIDSTTQQDFTRLQEIAGAASALVGVIDGLRTFQGFLTQHPLAAIETAKTRVAGYVATGTAVASHEDLTAAIELLKSCANAALTFLQCSACYKSEERAPAVVCRFRATANELIGATASFWTGEPTSDQLSLIEQSLALGDYLTASHDRLESACRVLAEFNSRHSEKQPVDDRQTHESITTARGTIGEFVKQLEERLKDAKRWPQVPCFTENISCANECREVALEVQYAYDALPRISLSGLAVFSFAMGLLSLGCMAVTGIPAIIIGHMALARLKWNRGRGFAIAGLALGYLMTGASIVVAIGAGMNKPRVGGGALPVAENSSPGPTKEGGGSGPTTGAVGSGNDVPVTDALSAKRREAALGSQLFTSRATDAHAGEAALAHLEKAVGEVIDEKKNITDWEGQARFQLAAICFEKQDMDRTRKLLDAVFDNESRENPSETASSYRLLKARVAETIGDPKRACQSYTDYFRPKIAKKAFDAEDREVFLRAWKLAVENREEVNLFTFCGFVEGILSVGDDVTIRKVRDVLKTIPGGGYDHWIEEIDKVLSAKR